MEPSVSENELINWSVDLTVNRTPSQQNSYELSNEARHVAGSYGHTHYEPNHAKSQYDNLYRVQNFLARHGYPTSPSPEYRYLPSEFGSPAHKYGYPSPKHGYSMIEYGYPTFDQSECPTSEYKCPNSKNGLSTFDYGYLTPEVILQENRNEDLNQAENLVSRRKHPTPELVLIKEEQHNPDTTCLSEEPSNRYDDNSNGFHNQTADQTYPTPELVLIKEERDNALQNEEDFVDAEDSFENEASEDGSDSSNLARHQEFEYGLENANGVDNDHTTDKSEWIWCQKCFKYFPRNQSDHSCNQTRQILSKPTKNKKLKPFSCTHCVRKFARVDQLVKHLRKRLGICPYICPVCGAYFGEHSDLLNHDCQKISVCVEEDSFKCGDCGKTFSGKNYLRKHQIRHLAVKRFKCDTCGKGFAEKYHLSRHQVTHSNVKELSCNECGKSFSLRQNLIVHQRIHLGIRPYKCLHCGRSFFQNVNRIAHELTHTGERPYKCVCREEFSSRYLLNKHSKTCKSAAKFSAREAKNGSGVKKSDESKNKIKTGQVRCNIEEVKNDNATVENEINEVRCDMEEVKNDASTVGNNTEEIRCDIKEVKKDAATVKNNTEEVRFDMEEVKNDEATVENNTEEIRCDIEEVKKDGATVNKTDEVSCDIERLKRLQQL